MFLRRAGNRLTAQKTTIDLFTIADVWNVASSENRFCSNGRLIFMHNSVPSENKIRMAVFWVVEPCSLVEVYQRFKGPCCLHHQDRPDDGGSKDL
jgi:hypothetical protein